MARMQTRQNLMLKSLRACARIFMVLGVFTVIQAGIGTAIAQTQSKMTVVLELFTSQGCSSCPPADRLLGQLKTRPDIVALSLPVDYWDYLGWKDTFARPENTVRQKAYSKNARTGSIYTPEIVVSGVRHAVGSRLTEVNAAIEAARADLASHAVTVTMRDEGDRIIIDTVTADKPGTVKPATIWLAQLTRGETVSIGRGENTGRKVTYHNIVRDMKKIGQWRGGSGQIVLPKSDVLAKDMDGCAVLVQRGWHGPIIGAAILNGAGS